VRDYILLLAMTLIPFIPHILFIFLLYWIVYGTYNSTIHILGPRRWRSNTVGSLLT
jgi:hypothetical protein